ncbi:Organic hydroperoxide resistance transcriptional regulator [Pseudodesulfovibrio hydrargyri]|uniref:Organic hydroperoxide resistance transcriptional regulator n=1 Tax=Pseudodesulfovibrio hydrargyri TaxID=2125990 RepID=A0A1J5NFC3_9BACT|nr:MarR family transcriptional regulator [Pseudodesulfovibrio hydrargyri]OIQ51919.1 Organic hydroperoxide resistance transcriptional regulator [Pseudodesulfovibrio hydrargyri]
MSDKSKPGGIPDGREHYAALPEYLSDGTIGFQLYSTALALKKRFSRALGESGFGVTQEQFTLLGLLWEHDGLYQSELAEGAFKDRHSVTRILAGLEARGLVERRPDETDARLARCHLTGAGRALCGPLCEVDARHLREAFRGMDAEEVAGLRKGLARLRRNLEEDLS